MPASNPSAPDPAHPGDDSGDDFPQRVLELTPRVRRFLRKLCRERADVDDLLQEAVARAVRYRHAFDETVGRLDRWMMKIAFRTFLDHREHAARQPRADDDAVARATGREVNEAELRDEVGFALRALTAIEQDIVLRFHQRRETIAEISRALGMPEGTVKSHLHRSRRKIAGGGEA